MWIPQARRTRETAAPKRTPLGLAMLLASMAGGMGCATTGGPRGTPASPAPSLPDGVHWVRNAAEYRAVVLQTYRLAARQIERLAADCRPGTWAVVADADDTVIGNSQYQKERALRGDQFTAESWAEWVRRRQAPPLPGSVGFLNRVRELGGRIAIVTNRDEPLCADTQANFQAFSIPFDVMLCRAGRADSDKQRRFDQVAQGKASPDLPPLEILMWMGDNIQDFPGLKQDIRKGPEDAFADFGSRFFAFPNPMYGSWTSNPQE